MNTGKAGGLVVDLESVPDLENSQADAATFLAAVRLHQEALWAVICHGRIVVNRVPEDNLGYKGRRVHVYRPSSIGRLDVQAWWEQWEGNIDNALENALGTAFPKDDYHKTTLHWIMPVPDDVADFVAKHSVRPVPSRFLSTAVEYAERDGIVWLTAPERVLYDRLKAAGWTFIPQPAVVLGDEGWLIPDFLVFWGGRAGQAFFVEVDSDTFHAKPSQRERDEAKERRFEALGFGYIRFSAKACLHEPLDVIAAIQKFCITKWGAAGAVKTMDCA